MASKILKVSSPAPRAVWRALLKSDVEAVPYQTPDWLDCICASGNYQDASRLYEFAGGRQMVLPMVRRRGWPAALAMAASLPSGWGMGGLIASSRVSADEVASVFADLNTMSALRVGIRPNPRCGQLWAAAAPSTTLAVPRLAHVLDLEGGFDRVWSQRFIKKTRARVRKAERSGVVVECDTTGKLVPVFYDLLWRSFGHWARRQHEPAFLARWRGQMRDPVDKFHTVARTLGDACRIWIAWVDGKPAAGSLVLQYANVNDARGAIDRDLSNPTGANDLIQSLAIEEACRSGCRYYHLGESGASSSLAHYKERFGAKPFPYAEYYVERLPVTRADQRLRGLVKRVIGFRDAPEVEVARRADAEPA